MMSEGIVNVASKAKYPRIGKQDREAQYLYTGAVETFVKRDCSKKIETQIKVSKKIEHDKQAR